MLAIACSVALALLLAVNVSGVVAQPATDTSPLQFQNTTEEARFHALVAELRCVMCQNQSLADSNAQIAVDLRREVLALMREGKSDREVKAFLVARYGEFVLYRPQVASKTWLLWFGPALVLLAGGLVVVTAVRRHRASGTRDAGKPSSRTGAPDDDQEW
jgi:cytochrome c-type biogenesis protein CcmH